MRFGLILSSLVSFSTVFLLSSAEDVTETPEILATAAFPENNAFNQVVNGEKNSLTITVENKSGLNVTLLTIMGSLHHPDTNALIKNLTTLSYGVPMIEDVKLQLPYTFFSEFKPGNLRLSIWADFASSPEDKYSVNAFDGIVTIVEPEFTIFDFKLISTYLVVAGILGGICYFAFLSFVPQNKKLRPKKSAQTSVSAPVGSVTATGAGGYQEEWIPEHHLRKTNKSAKSPGGAASGTSGDELSAGEVSGTDGKRRKGRK